MAVRKGKKAAVAFSRGVVVPMHRALGSRNKTAIFELPEATSSVRAIARTVDASAKVIKSLEVRADLRAAVTELASLAYDVRTLVVRPFDAGLDVELVTRRPVDIMPDTVAAVFQAMEKSFDCAMVLSRSVMPGFDVKQRIYVYLFRESHEIQV